MQLAATLREWQSKLNPTAAAEAATAGATAPLQSLPLRSASGAAASAAPMEAEFGADLEFHVPEASGQRRASFDAPLDGVHAGARPSSRAGTTAAASSSTQGFGGGGFEPSPLELRQMFRAGTEAQDAAPGAGASGSGAGVYSLYPANGVDAESDDDELDDRKRPTAVGLPWLQVTAVFIRVKAAYQPVLQFRD